MREANLVGGLPVLILAGFVVLFSQQEAPTFRIGTTLVEFTIVALDGKGRPVRDLKREEIGITEQGRLREVAFFRFEGSASPPAAAAVPELPAGAFTNRFEPTESAPRNISAIVMDTLNTPPSQQTWVRAQVFRYLRELAPGTRIALYQLGKNVRVLHDFTEDAGSLRERLATLRPEQHAQEANDIASLADDAERLLASLPPDMRAIVQEMLTDQMQSAMDFNAMSSENRTNQTLASLEALGNRLAGIPGRKSVVWISGGISMLSIGRRGSVKFFEERVVRSARRMATQGVTMYMVDALGLQTAENYSAQSMARPAQGRSDPFAMVRESASTAADSSATMYRIAAITGGRVSRNSNDMTMGMKAAAADQQGSYSVGFYAQSPPDDTWHSLAVKAKRPGVKLVYRQGYLAESASKQAADWTEQQWQAAILNPLGSTAIRLDAKAVPAAGGATGAYDGELEIEGGDLHFRPVDGRMAADIDLVVAEKTRAGVGGFQVRSATVGLPAKDARLRYTIGFQVSPDTPTLRVIVRDRLTGRFGMLDLDVKRLHAE